MKKLILTFISLAFLYSAVYAQSAIDINDVNYKFKFSLPKEWNERKIEETSKQEAISYSFEKKDGNTAIMLLALKVNEVKNLSDLVYTLEKDANLNIPKRDGDYTDFDSGNYDGRYAIYKDSEFSEVVYYYRTKISEGQNYTYVLRFIIPSTYFNSAVLNEVKNIAGNFSPYSEQ